MKSKGTEQMMTRANESAAYFHELAELEAGPAVADNLCWKISETSYGLPCQRQASHEGDCGPELPLNR